MMCLNAPVTFRLCGGPSPLWPCPLWPCPLARAIRSVAATLTATPTSATAAGDSSRRIAV